MRARRPAVLAVLLMVLSLFGGCMSLPTEGPVSTRPAEETGDEDAGSFDYTPSGPQPGSTPLRIVEDFLLAMQASPQSTSIARRYLTEEARAAWMPEQATLIYGTRLITGADSTFRVRLQETVQLDDRGAWRGQVGRRGGLDYPLDLQLERGEWRITNPPDALILPTTYFQTRYEQYFAYFFDPTARVLVPEPTYLPSGEQTATLLVRRLLRGPHPRLRGVLRSFIPGGTEYLLSVPVSARGIAEVGLSEQVLSLDAEERSLAMAQLAWTLRQAPGVDAMEITVDGTPIELPGLASPQDVDAWSQYDPTIHWASRELFGIRPAGVVALDPADGALEGRFSFSPLLEEAADGLPVRSVGVDLEGEKAAVVTADGESVVVGVRTPSEGNRTPSGRPELVYAGADVLPPAWDMFGDLWLLDRRAGDARLLLRDVGNGVVRTVASPGISGADVRALAVSRDGSRVAVVVRDGSGDRVAVSRVARGPDGRVTGLTPAVDLRLPEDAGPEVRDVAWRGPASLAALTGRTPDAAQVRLVNVDGATGLDADTNAEVLRVAASRLVASPTAEAPTFLGGPRGQLYSLSSDGQWIEADLVGSLLAPTYAG